jgi:hypothetical protein
MFSRDWYHLPMLRLIPAKSLVTAGLARRALSYHQRRRALVNLVGTYVTCKKSDLELVGIACKNWDSSQA